MLRERAARSHGLDALHCEEPRTVPRVLELTQVSADTAAWRDHALQSLSPDDLRALAWDLRERIVAAIVAESAARWPALDAEALLSATQPRFGFDGLEFVELASDERFHALLADRWIARRQ